MSDEEGRRNLHEAILGVVENQLRTNDPPETKETYKRLLGEGHSSKEARRLIACVVSTEIYETLKTEKPFDLERFAAALNRLPTMPWET